MKILRVKTIDAFRALTMFLMIWVNDFWTLTGVPKWLKHATYSEDYLGFSDVIFPLFLFIMGMSIPFAVEQRINKGETTFSITKHILIRTASLLIIGVFMVNYETAHHQSIFIGKYFWCFLMALGVSLIWMNWKKSPVAKKWYRLLQFIGVSMLIFLAIIYKGGTDGSHWMKIQWWGILGLIGWAYVANALLYLYSKGNLFSIVGVFIIFNVLSVLSASGLLPKVEGFLRNFSTIYQGTVPAFTVAGMVLALLLRKQYASASKNFILVLISIGMIAVAYGMFMRSFWGISKIKGTPSWLGVCVGIGFLLFALLYFICDTKGKTNWIKIISPAATATLTCYMIPYFIYPLRSITNVRFPGFINNGAVGLLGSLGFALLVIIFTGWLEKKGYTLKL